MREARSTVPCTVTDVTIPQKRRGDVHQRSCRMTCCLGMLATGSNTKPAHFHGLITLLEGSRSPLQAEEGCLGVGRHSRRHPFYASGDLAGIAVRRGGQ